jgi:hypothetical protein
MQQSYRREKMKQRLRHVAIGGGMGWFRRGFGPDSAGFTARRGGIHIFLSMPELGFREGIEQG